MMKTGNKLKKEKLDILSIIFLILIILHSLYLVFQGSYILSLFYIVPIFLLFVRRKLGILVGLVPSLYILFNPFPISEITYPSGALIKIVQALITTDPTTLGIGLSKAVYPILIIIFGITILLKRKK